MAAREETRPSTGAHDDPPEFRAAVADLHTARLRPEIFCEQMPAPQRIAPYATALSADVNVAGDEVGTGRLILLHDPQGNDAWAGGTFRLVAYVRAEVDADQITDAMLGEVAWSWLLEALEAHGAEHLAAAGSVTRVATESFGGMADDDSTAQVEIRASWTPVAEGAFPDIRAHAEAWGELLCTAAGLPPVPEGVAIIPTSRGQRGPA
ncbi:DUF3000 domain-containing protein [Nocardioides insulae]|uniref:DUF3000 domain-containing protein n=1 Tax=Nocardioides insulae TaxID=394734 RepID=UPI00041BE785|nr:DUF3000 domain-containing protein [Nocardioides insulae]